MTMAKNAFTDDHDDRDRGSQTAIGD